MNDSESKVISHVVIGGIIGHGSQYGFKLSFLDVDDARRMKGSLVKFFESQDIICTVRKGYFDGGKKEYE